MLTALLVVRALWQHKRYRAVDVLTPADLDALHEAVRAAERNTIGEIVPVVVERSDAHPQAALAAALAFAFAVPMLGLGLLPWGEPQWIVLAQFVGALAGWLLARALPGFARLFVSEARATHVANEQALQEFTNLGLHRTVAESGVLIFVSLLERRVIVLGDRGIDTKVGAEHWKKVDEAAAGIARARCADWSTRCRRGARLHFLSPSGGTSFLTASSCAPADRRALVCVILLRVNSSSITPSSLRRHAPPAGSGDRARAHRSAYDLAAQWLRPRRRVARLCSRSRATKVRRRSWCSITGARADPDSTQRALGAIDPTPPKGAARLAGALPDHGETLPGVWAAFRLRFAGAADGPRPIRR
jgi:putative membrane protein